MTEKKIPRPEHPQPMFKRENWQNLNGEWLFEFDFGTSGVERGLFKPEKADEYTKKSRFPSALKARRSSSPAMRVVFRLCLMRRTFLLKAEANRCAACRKSELEIFL